MITGMSFDEITQVPCSVLKTLPQTEIDYAVDVVINYYYAHGFPFYERDTVKSTKEFTALQEFDVSRLELPNNHLQQFMLGLNTVNSYHPEMWSVKCRNAKTPMDIFNDRELFRVALTKRIKYSDTKLQPFNIRKSLKAFGVQGVSNFRPTIAKWVYERYAPKAAVVLDPCMGYGGRLMGAMASHISRYLGTDPNTKTYNGNVALTMALHDAGSPTSVFLMNEAYEDCANIEKVDLVFTSPPYFDIEKYDDDWRQSYKRYPSYPLWKNQFFTALFERSAMRMRHKAYFVLNINEALMPDALEIGQRVFGSVKEIHHMRLSKMMGKGDKSSVSHKTEPILVWRKG